MTGEVYPSKEPSSLTLATDSPRQSPGPINPTTLVGSKVRVGASWELGIWQEGPQDGPTGVGDSFTFWRRGWDPGLPKDLLKGSRWDDP